MIRIPAKPGKCKHFSAFFIRLSERLGEMYANLSTTFELTRNRPFVIIIHSQGHLKASCFFVIL